MTMSLKHTIAVSELNLPYCVFESIKPVQTALYNFMWPGFFFVAFSWNGEVGPDACLLHCSSFSFLFILWLLVRYNWMHDQSFSISKFVLNILERGRLKKFEFHAT